MSGTREYISPPLKFERETGLTHIHTPWKMPGSLLHAEIEFLFEAVGQPLESFDILEALNPELKALSFVRKDPFTAAHAVAGVTSQFNLDDIRYYVTTNAQRRALHMDVTDLHMQIDQYLGKGAAVKWEASKATLTMIVRQLERHPRYGLQGFMSPTRSNIGLPITHDQLRIEDFLPG